MILKGLILAASDTVATTLEWAMLELVRHPHVMQRLQSELDASFEGMSGDMDEGIATQLPFLQVSTIPNTSFPTVPGEILGLDRSRSVVFPSPTNLFYILTPFGSSSRLNWRILYKFLQNDG